MRLRLPTRTCIVAATGLLAAAGLATAQPVPPPAAPIAPTGTTAPPSLEDVLRRLDEQQKIIEAQEQRIRELERRLSETVGPAATAATAATSPATPAPPQPAAEVSEAARRELGAQETAQVSVNPELEVADISKEFPGSFRIPGSNAALRIGGQVRSLVVLNLSALGSDDRFITSSIPIEGSEQAGKGRRTTFTVAPSRFNLDFRTPTGVGYARTFIEGDFAGDSSGFRLRHAYAQWDRATIGQTWSTFSDPEAEPDGIDFEGLNAISLFRQPQIRWTYGLGERFSAALALENPKPSISGGATGISQVPDTIARLRWNPKPDLRLPLGLRSAGAHVQSALLLRQLRAEPTSSPNAVVSTAGYGLNASGRLTVDWTGSSTDALTFAGYAGTGIGNYISDLRTLGGQDAYYDVATNRLEALPVLAGYAGYEHWWQEGLRSTVTYGLVVVDNVDAQPPDSLQRTDRLSLNLVWSPIPRVDLAAEYLWGRRINKDRQRGMASQVQLGGIYRF